MEKSKPTRRSNLKAPECEWTRGPAALPQLLCPLPNYAGRAPDRGPKDPSEDHKPRVIASATSV
ncbi:hypothetical protein RSAG8_10966, partial [Rhizoctonia solani AG-8 WAC10335]